MATKGISALGKVFHEACFTCMHCQVKLDDKFFPVEEEASCKTCYEAKHSQECDICHQIVLNAGAIVEGKGGKVFHPDCLKCNECSASLQGKFFTLEEILICEKCLKDQVRGYHPMASK